LLLLLLLLLSFHWIELFLFLVITLIYLTGEVSFGCSWSACWV